MRQFYLRVEQVEAYPTPDPNPQVRKLLGFLLACGRNGVAQGGGA